jgi:uncharacterized membrane protein YkvA (DUF1232 family)
VNILRLLSTAVSEVPRLVPLVKDERVPLWSKVLLGVVALLVISPLNLFGDIPGLGFIDDATLLLFVVHVFVNFAEKRLA